MTDLNSTLIIDSDKDYQDNLKEDLKSFKKWNKEQNVIFGKDKIISKYIKLNEEKEESFYKIITDKLNRNKEKTNEDSKKNEIRIDTFWELNSEKKPNLSFSSSLNDYIGSSFNIFNEDILDIVNEPKTKEKEEKVNFLCKKRKNLFKIIYPNKFIIFNPGGYNNYSRQFINNIFQSHKKNANIFSSKTFLKFQKRKENNDNIRKKIKCRFLKNLKNVINEKLKTAGSEKFFNSLQQKFISNVTKGMNKKVLNLTFKEVFSKNFCDDKIKKDVNIKRYNDNLSVLNYLEENADISQKSNYYNFKDMKYYEIFEEYLRSKEFEIEIAYLKRKNEKDIYIKKYIKLAYNLNFFFYD